MFSKKPLLIGHRGAAGFAPENTLQSFHTAFEEDRVDMIEFDIRLTQDAQVVICHDPQVDRTTNGHGFVAQLTLEEVQKLDAGFYFDPEKKSTFPARGQNVRVPTLEQAFEAHPDKPFAIEIKGDSTELVDACVEIVRKNNAEARCIIGSKSHRVSKRMKEAYPHIHRFFSFREIVTHYVQFQTGIAKPDKDSLAVASMPPERWGLRFYDKNFIDYLHKREIKAVFWTVNDPSLAQTMTENGADGIISDTPRLIRSAMNL